MELDGNRIQSSTLYYSAVTGYQLVPVHADFTLAKQRCVVAATFTLESGGAEPLEKEFKKIRRPRTPRRGCLTRYVHVTYVAAAAAAAVGLGLMMHKSSRSRLVFK